MWQAPNQRLRAQANARKRERERYKTPFHVKRVAVTIQLQNPGGEPRDIDARALLNDISPKGMGLFSAHHFNQGDFIAIKIESPEEILIKGQVTWCQEYFVAGKVLKTQSFSYRAGIQFAFETPEQEAAVNKFCDALLNTHHCVSLRPEAARDSAQTQVPAVGSAPAEAALMAPETPTDAPVAASDAPASEAVADSAAAPAAPNESQAAA